MSTIVPALESFVRALSFRLVEPGQPWGRLQRLQLERPGREPATVLDLAGAPFDDVNTEMPPDLKQRLRPLLEIPRMSTLATAGLLNRAVASMPPGQAYVNVGVWQGFTFLAGMVGNPDTPCIGIDNFSEFLGPRDRFLERYEATRSPAHHFFDMDYRDYFENVHDGPIGVYLYDGDHSYEHQMHGLEAAEPYFAEDCVLVVDDTNRVEPRQATLDFVAQRAGEYHVLADIWTASDNHPTFWNGLLVIRKGAGGETIAYPEPDTQRPPLPRSDRERTPTVSLVVLDIDGDGERSARAVDLAHAQTWPHMEVLVADATAQTARAALADAVARSSGSLVAFVDTSAELQPDAVELSVAYPDMAPFWRSVDRGRVRSAQGGIEAGAYVDQVLPPGSNFVLIADVFGLPATRVTGVGMRLAPPGRLEDLGDEEARSELNRLRAEGASHVVVMRSRFEWLERCPGLAAELAAGAETLLSNDRVRVFRFRS